MSINTVKSMNLIHSILIWSVENINSAPVEAVEITLNSRDMNVEFAIRPTINDQSNKYKLMSDLLKMRIEFIGIASIEFHFLDDEEVLAIHEIMGKLADKGEIDVVPDNNVRFTNKLFEYDLPELDRKILAESFEKAA